MEIDFDGYYYFVSFDFGIYVVEIFYVGYNKQCIERVFVYVGKVNKLDIEMIVDVVNLDEVVVISYKIFLVEQDNMIQGVIIVLGYICLFFWFFNFGYFCCKWKKDILNFFICNINSFVVIIVGVLGVKVFNELKICGFCSNVIDYYVDGIWVQGNVIFE